MSAPRDVAIWPGVVAAGLRAWPLEAGLAFGAWLADRVEPRLGVRKAVALSQLELALPKLEPAEREAIWRESVRNQGRNLVELSHLAGSPRTRARLVDAVEIVGNAHADHARSLAPEGRGVIVVTAHLGNWELCLAAMAAQGHPMSVVHHGLGRPGLSAWLAEVRTRQGDVELVQLGHARAGQLLATVRGGRHLVAMMDQNARRDEGGFAPFFGVPACTRRGPVVMAIRLGVPLLPAFAHRVGHGSRHRVEFGTPIEVTGEDAAGSNLDARVDRVMTRVNRVIEEAVEAHPEQWIWSHRRYKTRPLAEDEGDRAAPPSYPPRRRRGKRVSKRSRAAQP